MTSESRMAWAIWNPRFNRCGKRLYNTRKDARERCYFVNANINRLLDERRLLVRVVKVRVTVEVVG